MTTTSGPPMRTGPTGTTVVCGWNSRLTSLYGWRTFTTRSTPSMASSMVRSCSLVRSSPITPTTVRSTPWERCGTSPASRMRRNTASCCSGVHPACRTTIMASSRASPDVRGRKCNASRPTRDGRRLFLARYHPTSAARHAGRGPLGTGPPTPPRSAWGGPIPPATRNGSRNPVGAYWAGNPAVQAAPHRGIPPDHGTALPPSRGSLQAPCPCTRPDPRVCLHFSTAGQPRATV
jgi:hypothetical protein